MATISEGTVLRVVASILFPDNVIAQNVFHLVLTTAVGAMDEAEVGSDMDGYISAIYNELEGEVGEDIEPAGIKVYEFDSSDVDWDEFTTDVYTFVPTNVSQLLPHGVAGVTIFETINPDVQGKKFWAGLCESGQDSSIWIAAVLTAMALAGAEVIAQYTDGVSGNVYTPVIWSPTKTTPYAMSGSYANNAISGYQRRRKPGVGI